MPRRCSICQHDRRQEIDEAIVAGESYSALSRKYAVSRDSVRRHRENGHVDRKLIKAKEARETIEAGTLFDRVRNLHDRALRILEKAEKSEQLRAATSAIREVRGILELEGRLRGELEQFSINIHLNPQWVQIRNIIVSVLEKHPESLNEVLYRIEEILHESSPGPRLPAA
jgi:hypothetical protein